MVLPQCNTRTVSCETRNVLCTCYGAGMGCGASRPSAARDEEPGDRRITAASVSRGKFRDKYELQSTTLGRGSFAVVKHCKDKETGELRACKMISKYGQANRGDQAAQSAESMNEEIVILRAMGSHPNILQIYDVYETHSLVYLVLELAEGGSLTNRIAQKGISEADAASAMGQAAAAVKHLHEHSIVHRDIKMDNILLAAKNTFVIKLADFGLSKLVPEEQRKQVMKTGEARMLMASAQGSPASWFIHL